LLRHQDNVAANVALTSCVGRDDTDTVWYWTTWSSKNKTC